MSIQGIIFDLDGVIVSTDECHYQGWKQLADEEGISFSRRFNGRLRGVSRAESLEIILNQSQKMYSNEQKQAMTSRKNFYYRQLLKLLTPADILPGVKECLTELKERHIKIAIGSSSKNSSMVLDRIGLSDFFDVTVDGNDISQGKPNPEVFLKAAQLMKLEPSQCLVVEDSISGVKAALAAGMYVLAVGFAADNKCAHFRSQDLASISIIQILSEWNRRI